MRKLNQELVINEGPPVVVNLWALKVATSQGTPEVQRSAWKKEQLRRTSDLLR